jgi:hypothetical protein
MTMTKEAPGGLISAPPDFRLPTRIFDAGTPAFAELFNRRSFPFSHHLADHPLFSLSHLTELCAKLASTAEDKVTYQAAGSSRGQGWNLGQGREASVVDAVARIEESGSWVLLKGVQTEAAYRELLDRFFAEAEALTGAHWQQQVTWADAYIFLSSPGSITPFHIDHESNFLLQIHGEKEVSLFDANDRSVLPEEEIERYYLGEMDAAKYREDLQSRASVYHLTPGTGVHNPPLGPHWVRTGGGYSVTLSINFCLRSSDRQARVYQVNHLLRQIGCRPAPPGQSALRDGLKVLALEGIGPRRKATTKYDHIRREATRATGVVSFGRRMMSGLRPRSR